MKHLKRIGKFSLIIILAFLLLEFIFALVRIIWTESFDFSISLRTNFHFLLIGVILGSILSGRFGQSKLEMPYSEENEQQVVDLLSKKEYVLHKKQDNQRQYIRSCIFKRIEMFFEDSVFLEQSGDKLKLKLSNQNSILKEFEALVKNVSSESAVG